MKTATIPTPTTTITEAVAERELKLVHVFDVEGKRIALWQGRNLDTFVSFAHRGTGFIVDVERILDEDAEVAATGYINAALEVIARGHNIRQQQVWSRRWDGSGTYEGTVHVLTHKVNETYVDGVAGVTDFEVLGLPVENTLREEVCSQCGTDLTLDFDLECIGE